jgi:hypothetical protein
LMADIILLRLPLTVSSSFFWFSLIVPQTVFSLMPSHPFCSFSKNLSLELKFQFQGGLSLHCFIKNYKVWATKRTKHVRVGSEDIPSSLVQKCWQLALPLGPPNPQLSIFLTEMAKYPALSCH